MRLGKEISDKNFEEKIKERIAGKVDVQLGKRGVTEAFIREVKSRLDKHGVVKIRVLKSFRRTFSVDVEEIAERVAEETQSKVYEVRGFTFILIKEK